MAKYSQAFKLEVVNYYLSRQGGHKATGKRFGIYYTMMRKWVSIFERYGSQALAPKKKYNRYSTAFKYEVVQAVHQQGLSLKQTAIDFSVLEPTIILGWLKLYAHGGIAALKPKTLELSRKNEKSSSLK